MPDENPVLRIDAERLEIGEDEESLRRSVLRRLGLDEGEVQDFKILRRSLDARKKTDIHFRLNLEIILAESGPEEAIIKKGLARRPVRRRRDHADREILEGLPRGQQECRGRPLIIGGGPGGLFAAWLLAREGYAPLLIDRGGSVGERVRALRLFLKEGIHDPENNILFGEGGAGTFSDGKLTSRSRSPLTGLIHRVFLEAGAPADIAVAAKPHLGTDRLRAVLVFFRREIERLGGEFSFSMRMTGLDMGFDGRLRGIHLENGSRLEAAAVFLSPGHSARDTIETLHRQGTAMEFKPFQCGLRIEHPREMIDRNRFGSMACRLPAAEYQLNDPDHGVFSFCMCPGGTIVASLSEPGALCTNGMSRRRRAGPFSNAALMLTVHASDVPGSGTDPLAGIRFQRRIEIRAFELGGSDYDLPAQRAEDFIQGKKSGRLPGCSYRRGIRSADLRRIVPEKGITSIAEALVFFERRIPGFIGDGLLVGPESRGSSPVRLLRHPETRQSLSHPGLYPIGEGAGAAGGIISAALDGLRSAAAFIRCHRGPGS